jgi:DNA-binding protein HU-beta
MNKSELVAAVAEGAELTKKDAERAVNVALEAVAGSLAKGDVVAIAGFGNFKVNERAARAGRNPQTGAALQIAASKNVSFKAGKALKESL